MSISVGICIDNDGLGEFDLKQGRVYATKPHQYGRVKAYFSDEWYSYYDTRFIIIPPKTWLTSFLFDLHDLNIPK